ncbi:MAG: alpha-2-macroglobulin family protein [Gammaproteobacteria bacterium]
MTQLLSAFAAKLLARCRSTLQRASGPLHKLGAALFGQMSWQPPAWLMRIRQGCAPALTWMSAHLGAVALILALAGGLWWAQPMIQRALQGVLPDQVAKHDIQVTVIAPTRTEIEKEDAQPNPIRLEFSQAAAPLAGVGKEAVDVSLKPAHAGKWIWTDERHLEFQPGEDWPVGQRFKVRLGSKALAPHVTLAEREYEVRSPAFEVSVAKAEFYQDPVQPSQRKAVFDFRFSHPVQPAEFEKRLALSYRNEATARVDVTSSNVKFTVTYDPLKLNASVQSEALAIPANTATMALRLAPGTRSQRGGTPHETEIVQAVQVPGLYSLAIESVDTAVVTGDDGEPEHVLHLNTSLAVHEKEMARMLRVWVLPARASDPENTGWDDPAEVTENVLKRATPIALTTISQEREAGETHSLRFKADPGAYLFVRAYRGMKGVGGYQLGATRDAVLQVKAFAPELAIMSKGSLLALDGDKRLPILVRDLPGIHVEIARLLPSQLHLLATQSAGSFSKPEFNYNFSPDQMAERFEKSIPLKLRPGKTHYESIDFSDYLKNGAGERRGVFMLSVRGYDPAKGPPDGAESDWVRSEYGDEGEYDEAAAEDFDPAGMKDARLVVVTDLGFLIKQSVDGARDVFVQSIQSGEPVAGATVEVWGKNGLILTSQATDSSGRAHLPNLNAYKREKQAALMVVKKADDLAFMPLLNTDRGLDLSRFDVGGTVNSGLPNQMRAYLFSDRGMYRPGDTFHIGAIVKSGDWAQSATGLPVEAEIIDARGLLVKRETLTVGRAGMAEITYTSSDSSPTGNYTVNLNLARETGRNEANTETAPLRLGTVTVKVQEFLPDRMKVKAGLSVPASAGWVHPDGLKARVNVQNLFGTPAPKRRVESTLTLTPAYPAFPRYPDYAFFDPQRAKDRYSEPLTTAETDDKGNVELDLGLQRYATATYQLNLLVKAFEPEGGRSVAAETASLVSALPFMIGYKADGDLGYVSRGAVRKVSLIAIDPDARKIAIKNLKLQRVEQRVLSVLIKQSNGLYKYESRSREVLLKEQAFSLPDSGADLALDTGTPGNFAYIVRDANGLEMNRFAYSVAGAGNVSRSLDRNAELQLKLDRQDYKPGEEIEISIRAPYTGAGLITIERDRVYVHKWFKTTQTASVQKIRLPKNFEGNGYVSVQFVRDPASDEVYMSPLSYGVAPFATSLAARTAPIALTAPALVKPGQTLKMRLDSPRATRAVVFAVDEGILQVARYKDPDPLKFFFEKRALEVATFQTLDLILPEFKKLMRGAAPGGDAESPLGKHLNPFKRKTDKPVVFWSGLVDVNGSREFTYTVPENFNGSLRIMAVAVNDSTTAATAARTQVRGDLILLPTIPVALTPGDEVEIGIGLANNLKGSGKHAPVALTLSTSPHLEVVGAATQNLKVSENGEVSTKFRIRARAGAQARLGSASVVFTATHARTSARLSTDLSVRPASTFVTLVQTGRFQGTGEIKTQAKLFDEFQRNELAISASPWSFASGLIQYLEAYPHGCTEQITSQTFPSVILSGRPELAASVLNEPGKQSAGVDPKQAFRRTLDTLRGRQTADGAFGLWDANYVEPFASLYATHMLVEARERKLPVPEDMLRRASGYLQSQVASSDPNRYGWRSRAYAAYLLTRQGVVTSAALVNLRASLPKESDGRIAPDLGLVYLAASYQMLRQDQAARELLEPVWRDMLKRIHENKRRTYYDAYYDPLVHDAMSIYLIARHFPDKLRQLPPATFERIGAQIQEGGYHSLSSSAVVLAVDAYSNAVAQSAASKGVKASTINRQGVNQALALGALVPLAKAPLPIGTARVRLGNNGDFPLYYAVSESGYERDVPLVAQSKGLEITREFLDAQGKPITEARLGDELTVRLRIRATGNRVDNVAVADVLPGGLEPVLTSPGDSEETDQPLWRQRLGGGGSWQIQYADIREDRVLFYGHVYGSQNEVTYKVRATNVGEFVVPGTWGEAMYDRKTFARSAGGRFVIKPLAP